MPPQAHAPRSHFNGNGAVGAFIPPHSIESEQSTLGAMLIERPAVEKVFAILSRSDFYRENHQVLFDVIGCLARRGEPIDLITVPAELKDRNQLDEIGGMAYLASLFDTVPTAANVEYYAKIVEEKAIQRRAAFLALDILAATREGVEDTCRFIADLQTKLGSISKGKTGSGLGQRKPMTERLVDLADVAAPAELPLLFGQFLLKGAAHWLTGQTGLGKSTLLFNIACALAEGTPLWGIDCSPTRVLYCDMESGDVGRAHKIERLYRDSPRVRGQLLFLREAIKLPEELAELMDIVQSQEIGLVIFDTARRCFAVRDENDNAEVYNRVIPTLDALKAAGVATLTMGHPSKNGNGSARGAGAQEDAGDVNLTLTMHRGEVSDPDGVIALRVTKNRLLGLGIPPLFLKRIGDDQFERLDTGEPGFTQEPPATPTAKEKCAQDILQYLSQSAPAKHTQIVKEMISRGHAEGTAKKTITWLQQEERLIENNLEAGGYSLTTLP